MYAQFEDFFLSGQCPLNEPRLRAGSAAQEDGTMRNARDLAERWRAVFRDQRSRGLSAAFCRQARVPQHQAANPQACLTPLLVNLQDTPVNDLDPWLPDQWKKTQTAQAPA
jgi:hypothetical protein